MHATRVNVLLSANRIVHQFEIRRRRSPKYAEGVRQNTPRAFAKIRRGRSPKYAAGVRQNTPQAFAKIRRRRSPKYAEGVRQNTPQAFAIPSPGLERSDNPGKNQVFKLTLKGFALGETLSGFKDSFWIDPRVVATLQPWAGVSERLRRISRAGVGNAFGVLYGLG